MRRRGPPERDFPYWQHASLLCVHSILLGFTAWYLPRSTLLFTSLPPQQSSLDKPQRPFLIPITASPVWTLFWLCAGTGVCQAWWAGWIRLWWQPTINAVGKIKALRDAWVNVFVSSGFFHIIIVLFGAPVTSYIIHTYLLSFLISMLTILVPSYTLSLTLRSFAPPTAGADTRWILLFIEREINAPIDRVLVYPVLGAFLGAWLGAFPIPLDWDRPWQAWPLTPAYGALAGHTAGAWLAVAINTVLFFAHVGKEMQTTTKVPSSPIANPRKKKRRD